MDVPFDSFQATLFGSLSNELYPSDAPHFTSFYSIDNDGFSEYFDPLFVTSIDLGGDVKRITLDLSLLFPQNLVIDFLLSGTGEGFSTHVELDNVVLYQATVPEPTSTLVWATFVGILYMRGVLKRNKCLGVLFEPGARSG